MNRFLILLFLSLPFVGTSNGINVSGVSYNEITRDISFTLEWQNSWLVSGQFDAAWIFIKYAPNGSDNWLHAPIVDSTAVSGYVQVISYDDLGVMIYKSSSNTGTFGPQEFTLKLDFLEGAYQDFKIFATEIVYIDNGDFYAGDGTSQGRFYADGDSTSGWLIEDEGGVLRGNGVGQFNQTGSTSSSNLEADFPKGTYSFFSMKYKITAQQYVDFLNCLPRTKQNNRVAADLTGIVASNKYVMTDTSVPTDRNPIACNTNIGTGSIDFFVDLDESNPPNSANDGANIALNYLSPQDILAYLDWSGMRPMSELEYEKICRGEGILPVPNEYAWGTDTYSSSGTINNSGANNETTSNVGILDELFNLLPLRAGYSATATSTRSSSSATYWGIMDIHNLGEFMYGIESTDFTHNSYGDGYLDNDGNSNNLDWLNGAQLLTSFDSSNPAIEPISKQKYPIAAPLRSAGIGGRGIRRILFFE